MCVGRCSNVRNSFSNYYIDYYAYLPCFLVNLYYCSNVVIFFQNYNDIIQIPTHHHNVYDGGDGGDGAPYNIKFSKKNDYNYYTF